MYLISIGISILISRYFVNIVSISYRNWKKWYRNSTNENMLTSWIMGSSWRIRRGRCQHRPSQVCGAARVEQPMTWERTEHRERTTSFNTRSCHLTPKIVRRQRIWNTFSYYRTQHESVQLSHPSNAVGTISDCKCFTRGFTVRAGQRCRIL